jgi:hypothetical protein
MRTNSRKQIMAVARSLAREQQRHRNVMWTYQLRAKFNRQEIERKRRRRKMTKTMERWSRNIQKIGQALVTPLIPAFQKMTAAMNLFAGQVLHIQDGMARSAAEYFKTDTGSLKPSLQVEHDSLPVMVYNDPSPAEPTKQLPHWKGRGK